MEKSFPESIFHEQNHPDIVYCETRNFINSGLPFSLHTDQMLHTDHHYVHKHREVELLVPIFGAGQVVADLKVIPMTEGDVVVINPNKVHYILSENVFTYYCLIVDSVFLEANGIYLTSLYFEDCFRDDALVEQIHRLNEEWKRDDIYRGQLLRAMLIEIMVRLCREHVVNETVVEKESRTLQKIKQSINYIKNNFRCDLTLDEIAGKAGLSKYHYCREFKKATDLTPVEFINRTRCEFAKSLLESNKYSVAEISVMCGFATSAHFSKTFRGFFDRYPSDFNKVGHKSDRKKVGTV